MPLLDVTGVSRDYGGGFALRGVSLAAERGEIVCLLGPSGCGKTTLLRIIAGLETPDAGAVAFDGQALTRTPPRLRGFGLMFQDLALFPHMDVAGNVSFGLRMQGSPRPETRERVDELLRLVELDGFARRKVHELSGGERQRVALARSLAAAPRLLMLDEPLGALDRPLREALQAQVRRILKSLNLTALYVTHDRDEAFAMADTIAVMESGRIVQTGTPEALFRAPRSALVAHTLGVRNALAATVAALQDGMAQADTPVGVLTGVAHNVDALGAGAAALVCVDERSIALTPAAADDASTGEEAARLAGVVESLRFQAGVQEVKVRVGTGALVCTLPPDGAPPAPGEAVAVVIPTRAVRIVGAAEPD